MATIYSHKKPNDRMLYWAHCRRDEIKNQIEQLQLEDGLMADIISKFTPLVCPACMGQGHVMRPIPGCECDGPRMHRCDRCKGTGEPHSSVSEREQHGS